MFFPPEFSRQPSVALDRAFTLLELLATVALVAALTGIVIGVGRRAAESGKIARTRVELATLSAALEGYRTRHGDYPRTADAVTFAHALLGRVGPAGERLPAAERAWIEAARFSFARPSALSIEVDPFEQADAVLVDPWRQPYRYAYKTPAAGWTNPSFVLLSAGPDGNVDAGLLPGGFIAASSPANVDNILPDLE